MYASELFQETDIVLIQQTHVINLILKQRNTLKANAKSKSGIPVRVNAAHLQHMGMDHAAAQDLNPARTLTEPAALAAAFETGHIHFCAGFCEREMMGTEFNLCLRSEQLFCKLCQRAL